MAKLSVHCPGAPMIFVADIYCRGFMNKYFFLSMYIFPIEILKRREKPKNHFFESGLNFAYPCVSLRCANLYCATWAWLFNVLFNFELALKFELLESAPCGAYPDTCFVNDHALTRPPSGARTSVSWLLTLRSTPHEGTTDLTIYLKPLNTSLKLWMSD